MSGDDGSEEQKEGAVEGNLIEVLFIKGKRVVLAGVEHGRSAVDLTDVVKAFDEFREEKGGKVTLVGEAGLHAYARELYKEDPKKSFNEVVMTHGDQVGMCYLALQKDVELDSWDMTFSEQIEEAKKRFGAETTATWFLSQAFIHLQGEGKDLRLAEVLLLMEQATGLEAEEIKDFFGDHFSSQQEASKLLKETFGQSWDQIVTDEESLRTFTRLADPNITEDEMSELSEGERKIVGVPKAMGSIRDEHGLEKIRNEVNNDKHVFVFCGRDHAENFRDSLKADKE